MKLLLFAVIVSLGGRALAADTIQHLNTYVQAYGETKNPVAVDPARDLPRYPAVEPQDAIATWKVKAGFKLEFAAHEPQVRDPIALCFDENGRMFVCEMIDYSERRDETPHLGRISMLEDKDGDGYYETSTIFADNLPWPTGLIWANGGLYVAATPDIWRFEDKDGDGRAEVREKVFTGFGTGLKLLNVQGLMNSFQWGQDNRIHLQCNGANRGILSNLKHPELPEMEVGGHNFWFDPRTYEWGLEGGGAQYGMSFDNYGRQFGCSNSDHLQFWVYEDRYAARNPFYTMPPSRQSIAADGGAAEVFRISPDEPWRIIRTRWRIGGVVKGMVEGGGRVSGYFTGASGTTVFRGDAYGDDFVDNTFTGDAGGQLVHRKKIYPDGVSLVGRRPDDEQGMEFAASTDTWVRVVNFANAPDGCLHICDMYREVIEHPWSIPEEIKQHLDLNNGNIRGRIYRLVPTAATWHRRNQVHLGSASIKELVTTLEHPNGWHRDTAARLLFERQDRAAVPMLARLVRNAKSPLARHHALGVLDGLGALDEDAILPALDDGDPQVRERGVALAEKLIERHTASARLLDRLAAMTGDSSDRVRLQLIFTIETGLATAPPRGRATDAAESPLAAAYARLAVRNHDDSWLSAALLAGPPEAVNRVLFPAMTRDPAQAKKAAPFVAQLIEIRAASKPPEGYAPLIEFVSQPDPNPLWIRALGDGLHRAGSSIDQADTGSRLAAVFSRAAARAANPKTAAPARLEAIELLGVSSFAQSRAALVACLGAGQPGEVQVAAIKTLAPHATPEVTAALLQHWPHYAPAARASALAALVTREDRIVPLLEAIKSGAIKPTELGATQVQHLAENKNAKISALARNALATVIPPSRAEVTAKFQPAIGMPGDAGRGHAQYLTRCTVCHRSGTEGKAVGPDLITVKTKGRESLLTAILDPNKEVASQFIAYDVNTKDGQAYTGIIARDDATSLTLRIMGGAEIALERTNVKGSSSSGKSLMPEGVESGMSVQDMADLLSFIEEQK